MSGVVYVFEGKNSNNSNLESEFGLICLKGCLVHYFKKLFFKHSSGTVVLSESTMTRSGIPIIVKKLLSNSPGVTNGNFLSL